MCNLKGHYNPDYVVSKTDTTVTLSGGDSQVVITRNDDGTLNNIEVRREHMFGLRALYKDGKLHTDDNSTPSFSSSGYNCVEKWHKNGQLHRDDDKPAVDGGWRGGRMWYKNGQLHRDSDEPSVVTGNTSKWYKNGLLHRENNLPAVITDKRREWHVNGQLIRAVDL